MITNTNERSEIEEQIDSDPEVVYAKEQVRLKAEARLADEAFAAQQAAERAEAAANLEVKCQAAVDWSFARFGTYNAFSNPKTLSDLLRGDGVYINPKEIVGAMRRAINGSMAAKGADGKVLVVSREADNAIGSTGKIEDYAWMWVDAPSA